MSLLLLYLRVQAAPVLSSVGFAPQNGSGFVLTLQSGCNHDYLLLRRISAIVFRESGFNDYVSRRIFFLLFGSTVELRDYRSLNAAIQTKPPLWFESRVPLRFSTWIIPSSICSRRRASRQHGSSYRHLATQEPKRRFARPWGCCIMEKLKSMAGTAPEPFPGGTGVRLSYPGALAATELKSGNS